MICICFLLNLLLPILFPYQLDVPFSTSIYDQDSTLLCSYLSVDDKWRMEIKYEEIPENLKTAILFKEDKLFFYHFGINPFSITRAFFQNITGQRTVGASTITMQVARMLQKNKRTYWSKIKEIIHSLWLELRMTKQEILAVYFNLAPYGGNIEGIKAATRLYFDKPISQLSLSEITVLTIIPNNPNQLRPDREGNKIKTTRNFWLQKFSANNVFSESSIAQASSEELERNRFSMVQETPHFCRMVKRKFPHTNTIITMLNRNMQQMTNDIVTSFMMQNQNQEIYNAAAIIIDNKSKGILAYLGSHDFNDNEHAGQVDGITAIRSPGSTLKPMAYGIAFEQGWLTPSTKVLDIPTNYSGFSPVNYDKTYKGWIDTDDALRQSLNIPAVRILEKVGFRTLIDRFEYAGFSKINKEQDLGLSVILGGCGVTLLELSNFYAALANYGYHSETIIKSHNSRSHKGIQIIDSTAAYLVYHALVKHPSGEMNIPEHRQLNFHDLAWKTGTSYGRKDAWCIGYNKNITIAIWVGNFDGIGNPQLSGATHAKPILISLGKAIETSGEIPSTVNFNERYVCTISGMPRSNDCKETYLSGYIDHLSSFEKCNVHQSYWTNHQAKYSYCNYCIQNDSLITKEYIQYPNELQQYYADINRPIDFIPPHNPSCAYFEENKNLIILTPNKNVIYYLKRGDEIELRATNQEFNDTLFWYINQSFLGTSVTGEKLFYIPQNKEEHIYCVDGTGNHQSLTIEIEYLME